MKNTKQKQHEKVPGLGKNSMLRAYLFFILLFLFGFAVILKALQIQLTEGDELIANFKKDLVKVFKTEAMRGNIYSADGNLLATSTPIYEVRMDAASGPLSDSVFKADVSQLAYQLSKLFGDHTNWEYKQKLLNGRKKGERGILIQRNVTYDQLTELKKFPIFKLGQYRGGLLVERYSKREYPFGLLAKRTIGYSRINEKDTTLVGLEGYFHDYLEGKPGQQERQYVGNNFWKPLNNEFDIEPEDGKDVITTINTYLQDVAENALMKQLKAFEGEKGTVILMDVPTGEIKAIANLVYNKGCDCYLESYNLAIGEAIEPGSTFKLASLMVAMEDGTLDKIDSVAIGDGWTMYYGKTMKDTHLIDADGWITPEECLVYSSNVGVSRIINDNYTGREWDFYRGITKLFPTEATGIEVYGEPSPKIKNPDSKDWTLVTLPYMSIGYEITVTPLQMLTFYNAVANNGKMVRPHLVKYINEAGKIIKEFKPEVIKKSICSDKTLATARQYLESVVEKGTGNNVRNDLYKIAGKTGTAKVNENGEYIPKYNASFAGYFPADNPKYSCIVVIYRPNQGGYYASQVAAPVFKEIANIVYATELDIHPENQNEYVSEIAMQNQKIPEDKLQEKLGLTADEILNDTETEDSFSEFMKLKQIPDVTGLGATDAVFLLENMGLVVKIKGRGLVKKQSLNAGRTFRKGDEIYLTMEI